MTDEQIADPATIDVNEVMANINQSWIFRRKHWDDSPSWPNVTVKALADEIRHLRRLIVLLDEVAPLDHGDIVRLYQRYADIDGMAEAAMRAFGSGSTGGAD